MQCTLLENYLSNEDKEYYKEGHLGWIATNDCLKVQHRGAAATYVVFLGPYTKPYMCRDCGEYYSIVEGNTEIKVSKNKVKMVKTS